MIPKSQVQQIIQKALKDNNVSATVERVNEISGTNVYSVYLYKEEGIWTKEDILDLGNILPSFELGSYTYSLAATPRDKFKPEQELLEPVSNGKGLIILYSYDKK